jgi:hypothetical protein
VLPLSEAAAAELVGDRFPSLAPQVRQRLLAEADGNPLALLELPVPLSAKDAASPIWRANHGQAPAAQATLVRDMNVALCTIERL